MNDTMLSNVPPLLPYPKLSSPSSVTSTLMAMGKGTEKTELGEGNGDRRIREDNLGLM